MSEGDQASSTSTSSPDLTRTGLQYLSVSSTGPLQSVARLQGELLGEGQLEYLQFASSPSGVLEVRRDWNTLLIALHEPFTVPGTDLQAKQLQIEIPGWSVELEDDETDPDEDRRENVTVHFLEPRVHVQQTQHQAEESIEWDMRCTTREDCTIVGPVVWILTEGEYPPGGWFSLQLSLPSSGEAESATESQGEGDRAAKRFFTLRGLHSRGFEAVKLTSPGSECFLRILSANTSYPVDDAENTETPPRVSSALGVAPVDLDDGLGLLQGIDGDGSSGVISQEPISFGPGDSVSDAQVFFCCPSSMEPFDWRSQLTPLSVARRHILSYRNQAGQSGDDDDSDSEETVREDDGSDADTVVESIADTVRGLEHLHLEH